MWRVLIVPQGRFEQRLVEGRVHVARVRRERAVEGRDRLFVTSGARQRVTEVIGARGVGCENRGGLVPSPGRRERRAFPGRVVEDARRRRREAERQQRVARSLWAKEDERGADGGSRE